MRMAKPSVIGRMTKNIVTEPWFVNSSLYSSGLMKSFSGRANCSRITSESTLPPSNRKKNPTNSKRLPMASFCTAINLPMRPGGSAHSRRMRSAVSGAVSTFGVSIADTSSVMSGSPGRRRCR